MREQLQIRVPDESSDESPLTGCFNLPRCRFCKVADSEAG
jgi:hypothetical protein